MGFKEMLLEIGHTEHSLNEIMEGFGDVKHFSSDYFYMIPVFSKIQGIGIASFKPFAKGEYICPVVNDKGERLPSARYCNHSSNPNSVFIFSPKGIHAVAKEFIAVGEEITVDYADNFRKIRAGNHG